MSTPDTKSRSLVIASRITMAASVVVILVVCVFFREQRTDNSEVVVKHLHFLESQLDDENEFVRAEALDCLAEYNPRAWRSEIRAALMNPSVSILHVALSRIRRIATAADLQRIRDIVQRATAQANQRPEGDDCVTESFGLDALLASHEERSRAFAVETIKDILAAKDTQRIRWEAVVGLVGDYDLEECVPMVRQSAPDEARQQIVAIALVKCGDEKAGEQLRRAFSGDLVDAGLLWRVANDPEALNAAKLNIEGLRGAARTQRLSPSIDRDILLAQLGDVSRLLERLRSLAGRGEDGRGRADAAESVIVAAGNMGTHEFLPLLDDLFSRSSDPRLRILCCGAVTRILKRELRRN